SPATLGCADVPGVRRSSRRGVSMKVHHTSVTVQGDERIEITDVTKLVRTAVHESGVRQGIAIAHAQHTTCALFIHEFPAAPVEDLKALVRRLVPAADGY